MVGIFCKWRWRGKMPVECVCSAAQILEEEKIISLYSSLSLSLSLSLSPSPSPSLSFSLSLSPCSSFSSFSL